MNRLLVGMLIVVAGLISSDRAFAQGGAISPALAGLTWNTSKSEFSRLYPNSKLSTSGTEAILAPPRKFYATDVETLIKFNSEEKIDWVRMTLKTGGQNRSAVLKEAKAVFEILVSQRGSPLSTLSNGSESFVSVWRDPSGNIVSLHQTPIPDAPGPEIIVVFRSARLAKAQAL